MPSVSILAEPTVSVVDKIVDKRGTREVATEYLNYLYSDDGQEIAAKHFYRPTKRGNRAKYADKFAKIRSVHDQRRIWRLEQGEQEALR